jgi:hypothetical protein
VEAVHVNSRPWSVKDNKQLLKPRESRNVGKNDTSSQSKHPYLSDYKQVYINISKFTLLFYIFHEKILGINGRMYSIF